jgi:phosphatidate phosphatase LPIN
LSLSPPESNPWNHTQHIPKTTLNRSASEELLPVAARAQSVSSNEARDPRLLIRASVPPEDTKIGFADEFPRSRSPPPLSTSDAVNRAKTLSQKLSGTKIPTHITETGDLMLDMHGYKSSEEEALRAEVIARKILSEEVEGNYDIGALIGADEHGNLWIYSSEEAKEAAARKAAGSASLAPAAVISDAASDPGYHSDEDRTPTPPNGALPPPTKLPANGLVTPPKTPPDISSAGDPNRNYAKTLRLTSDQLKELKLQQGPNLMSFSVNKATCQAYMYYWKYNVPVVISDIDGTITKSVQSLSN